MDSQQKQKEKFRTLTGTSDTSVQSQKSAKKSQQSTTPGKCPQCGSMNDPAALFCENCGAALRECTCPNCGEVIDPECDYCESCHTYISEDKCSFCSSPISESDTCCPECGMPCDGVECPVCHSQGHFGFCKVCGTPLTDSARLELKKAWEDIPFLNQIKELESQLEELWMTAPVSNAQQRLRREMNEQLRSRVLKLLQQDGEELYVNEKHVEKPILDDSQLRDMVAAKRKALQELLDKMQMPLQEVPATARIVAMARKPQVSKLAWQCNYKHALHTSPLGCACPQKGGRWIVLDKSNENSVIDD